jgi:XTP/dITP diphosphohydrolase
MLNIKEMILSAIIKKGILYEANKVDINVDIPNGNVINKELGENGFGYDPIFYLPEYKQTTAQISSELKNKISHRPDILSLMA